MSAIQVLFPLGGLGSRFADEGYTTPKPLIKIDGIPMILKAASSLRNIPCKKNYIFVVRKEHLDEYNFLEHFPDATIVPLDHNTKGATETCMEAAPFINDELPLIIMDCDLYFQSKEYEDKVIEMTTSHKDKKLGGCLVTFHADSPRYSYARSEEGKVLETAEKVVISDTAIAGAYCFGSGKIFKDAATRLLDRNISENMKEYYISLLFNDILAHGYTVYSSLVDEYYSFGTPEELTNYVKSKE